MRCRILSLNRAFSRRKHAEGLCNRLLSRVYNGARLVEALRGISATLEQCAWQSVAEAIEHTTALAGARGHSGDAGWILPVIVGGDDITVVLHGGYAFEFTVALSQRFEHLVNQSPLIAEALAGIAEARRTWRGQQVTTPLRVTLANGLVFTKPHHPFSNSVDLATQLMTSAKSLKPHGVSAIDVHVLRETALRSLDALRESLHAVGADSRPIRLWAGPIALAHDLPTELRERGVDRIREAMTLIARPASAPLGESDAPSIPSAVLHDLREALLAEHAPQARVDAVSSRARTIAEGRPYADALSTLLSDHLAVVDDANSFCRLLTAANLCDVEWGTAVGRRRRNPTPSVVTDD